jgi:hypothetical protein
MSQIEQRGNSYRVNVYAGVDPLAGKRIYLRESTTDLAEARRIRNKFRSQVDEQRHARTKATVRPPSRSGKYHDVDPRTREDYENYLRLYIDPAFAAEPIGKVRAHTIEKFHAEPRR